MARERRDLAWLRSQVSWCVDFNEGQTDQSFSGPTTETNKWIDNAVNQAYEFEVNQAQQECGWRPFRRIFEFTWGSGDTTYVLPEHMQYVQHLVWTDITDLDPGVELIFDVTALHWKDHKTVQWGSTGPGRDTTVRAEYLAAPVPLEHPFDEPELVPPRFRWLIVWQAASKLLTVADQNVPDKWLAEIDSWRSQFHSSLNSGNPIVNDPAVIKVQPYDISSSWWY